MKNEDLFALIQSVSGRIRLPARKAPGVALLMEKHAPSDLSAAMREKLDELLAEGAKVDAVLGDRDMSPTALQPVRAAFTSGWSAFINALQAAALLPKEISDRGPRADALLAKYAPDGLEFTTRSALEAYMYGRRVLALIEKNGHKREIASVIGGDYLQAVQTVTQALGEAVGLGETTRRVPTSKAVADAMDTFLSRLSAYTRGLAAEVDERDPASVQRFLQAVAPIQEHRTTWSADTAEVAHEPAPQVPPSSSEPKPVPQLAPQAGVDAVGEATH